MLPVGYTESVQEKLSSSNSLFGSEFLWESKNLYDTCNSIGTDLNVRCLVGTVHEVKGLLQEDGIR